MGINEFKKGTKFSMKEEIEYNGKAVVSKHVLKKSTGNVSLFAFDKGEGLSEHTTPFDALVSVVEGSAEVIIDGHSHNLIEGETIIMPAGIPHALNALERFKMVLTMIRN